MTGDAEPGRISVAVLCTSGEPYLSRCLDALRRQEEAPAFDVTIVCDPAVGNIAAAGRQFPGAAIVVNTGQSTPLTLASRALRECTGELILLTKDYCVPHRRWIRTMVDAQRVGRAAVGGRVEIDPQADPVGWAYFFIDFFRYTAPVDEGPVTSLSVCNISYRRRALEAVAASWGEGFVETSVHEALQARFGVLWMEPASQVTIDRRLTLREALLERYAYGRLFGSSRLAGCSTGKRVFLAAFAPGLPLLFLARMAAVALRSRGKAAAFGRSLGALILIVIARTFGEWLGYVTGSAAGTDAYTGSAHRGRPPV